MHPQPDKGGTFPPKNRFRANRGEPEWCISRLPRTSRRCVARYGCSRARRRHVHAAARSPPRSAFHRTPGRNHATCGRTSATMRAAATASSGSLVRAAPDQRTRADADRSGVPLLDELAHDGRAMRLRIGRDRATLRRQRQIAICLLRRAHADVGDPLGPSFRAGRGHLRAIFAPRGGEPRERCEQKLHLPRR